MSFQARMLFILAAAMGALLLPFINLQLNPSPRTQKLSVSFFYPNAGPAEVERQVTSILEGVLSRLEYLVEITSTSSEGQGEINLSFSEEADMEDVRLNVSVLIRQISTLLPEALSYPEISYRSKFETKSPLLSYALVSDLSGTALGQIIQQKLMGPLGQIKGISDITLKGLQKEECQITYDNEKLTKLQIDPNLISTVVRNWNTRNYIGNLQEHNGRSIAIYFSSHQESSDKVQALGEIPVTISGGRTIQLNELADIKISPQVEHSYYRINGQRSTNMTIYADEDVNFIRLAATCRQMIDSLENSLPEDIDLILENDRSAYLADELLKIGIRMLAAMGILLLSMVIIYRNVLKIFAVWSGFIISLLVSVIIYYLAGLELHLYSLAGLTLSLGIVLDNLIITTDHNYKPGNQRIFIAILAATLTTIGALSVIFFISPEYREQLTDFAWIFIINVLVSLIVSLFYIPAIIIKKNTTGQSISKRRRLVRFDHIYTKYCHLLVRHSWIPSSILVLSFGIPLFLLPNQLEYDNRFSTWYNMIMDGWYGKNIHSTLSKYAGGTLRLFSQNKDQFYFAQTERQETRLYVRATVPFGGTTEQLNDIIKEFESYIKSFAEVKQTNSYVSGPTNSSIEISFLDTHAEGAFPYILKSLLESKAIETGSGDFQIFGVGRSFDNEHRGQGLSTHLKLLGYNYDQLQEMAIMASKKLLSHIRIQKVFINPTQNYFAPDDKYFKLVLDENLLKNNVMQERNDYLDYWQNINPNKGVISFLQHKRSAIPIQLLSSDEQSNEIWRAQHTLHPLDSTRYIKNEGISDLVLHHGENKIVRFNQQYQLFLEYDFIGNYGLAEKVKEKALKEIKSQLPPGYQISDDQSGWWWRESQDKMTYIVLASLLVIFLISAILFNSLRQALIPLILVPISFIGIFLAVYYFDFRFDHGGFAAFLLVAGLAVNAGIFIINDYNNIRKHRNISGSRSYIKAYNAKIIPILLTALSTILGLLPFLLFEKNEPFWYSLAICTIAGLFFSIIGVVGLLPLCLCDFSHWKKESK